MTVGTLQRILNDDGDNNDGEEKAKESNTEEKNEEEDTTPKNREENGKENIDGQTEIKIENKYVLYTSL